MHARVLTIMHTVYWAIVLLNYTEGMLSQSIYYVVVIPIVIPYYSK
jgi:hypothetical protein